MAKKRTQLDRDVEQLHKRECELGEVYKRAVREHQPQSWILDRTAQIRMPTTCSQWTSLALRKFGDGCLSMMYLHLEHRLYRASDGALVTYADMPDSESASTYFVNEGERKNGRHVYIASPHSVF